MAVEKEPVDTQQPSNRLSEISDRIRKDLITRNNYGGDKNIYGATNKDAIGDGDLQGKGTGSFLDIYNGGNITDNVERKSEIKINPYQPEKPYTIPTS